MIKDEMAKSKKEHRKKMDTCGEEVRSHIAKDGAAPCDYLTCRREREIYHRGAWNALNELERALCLN